MFGLVYAVWRYLLYSRKPSGFCSIIRILWRWWHLKLDSVKQLVFCLQEHWFLHVRVHHSIPPVARPNIEFSNVPRSYRARRLLVCEQGALVPSIEELSCRIRTSQCYMVRRLSADNIGPIDSWIPSATPTGVRKILSLVWAVACCWDKSVHGMFVIQSTKHIRFQR